MLGDLPDNAQIDVITTLPNRYYSFSADAPETENDGRVTIRRIRLPTHHSGMVDQAKAFWVYAAKVLGLIRGKNYNLVFATSSRMFTGFLGAICAKHLHAPLYLDIRDIFNDTIRDVLNGKPTSLFMPMLEAIERFTISQAKRVNVVSEGFLPYFHSRYPKQSFSFFPNGVDDEFINYDFNKSTNEDGSSRRILYAGNIGQGQGLHRIIPDLASMTASDDFVFDVIGDGGARDKLERDLAKSNIQNVQIHGPVIRAELMKLYRNADILFLHLNDLNAFKKVLPSKLFEYAATGKPILAGIAGYSAQFLLKNVCNAVVFPPCDTAAAKNALYSLNPKITDRTDFISRFRRDNLMHKLVEDIIGLI